MFVLRLVFELRVVFALRLLLLFSLRLVFVSRLVELDAEELYELEVLLPPSVWSGLAKSLPTALTALSILLVYPSSICGIYGWVLVLSDLTD